MLDEWVAGFPPEPPSYAVLFCFGVMGTPDIKVITSVRQSGKSTLLKLFEEYVANSVEDVAITHISLNEKFRYLCSFVLDGWLVTLDRTVCLLLGLLR